MRTMITTITTTPVITARTGALVIKLSSLSWCLGHRSDNKQNYGAGRPRPRLCCVTKTGPARGLCRSQAATGRQATVATRCLYSRTRRQAGLCNEVCSLRGKLEWQNLSKSCAAVALRGQPGGRGEGLWRSAGAISGLQSEQSGEQSGEHGWTERAATGVENRAILHNVS
jgi:hypothetical protein